MCTKKKLIVSLELKFILYNKCIRTKKSILYNQHIKTINIQLIEKEQGFFCV